MAYTGAADHMVTHEEQLGSPGRECCQTIKDDDEEGEGAESGRDELAMFAHVLGAIDFDQLQIYACGVRKRYENSKLSKLCTDPGTVAADFDCNISSSPLYGSFHILFPLTFNDGTRWLLIVPATGHCDGWDESAARALESEALMMRKLASETTIRVPTVYAFESSLDNEVRCPFILMECIDGVPLHHAWFDEDVPKELLKRFRARALRGLAAAMLQLKAYSFPHSGSPTFGEAGNIVDISPSRIYDCSAMYDKLRNKEDDDNYRFCEVGPFTDIRHYLHSMLDRHHEDSST